MWLCQILLLFAQRRTYRATENAVACRTSVDFPLKTVEFLGTRLRNLVHRVERVGRIHTIGDADELAVADVRRHITTLDICHHRNLRRALVLLHKVYGLHVSVHIVTVNLIVAEVCRHLFSGHLIVVCRVHLCHHHRLTLEIGVRNLAVCRVDVHHVGGNLVALAPHHRREEEVNNRVAARCRQRVAHHLRVATEHLDVANCQRQTICRIDGHRVGCLGCLLRLLLFFVDDVDERIEHTP